MLPFEHEIIWTKYTLTARRFGNEAAEDGVPVSANPFNEDIAADSFAAWHIGWCERDEKIA